MVRNGRIRLLEFIWFREWYKTCGVQNVCGKKQFSGKKLIDLDMTLKMEIIVPGPESTNLLFQVQALIKTNETS